MAEVEFLEHFTLADAQRNMAALRDNAYPGRLAGAGISADGEQLHVVTAIMGRRASSQTRVYRPTGDSVISDPWGKDVDPLTAYRTMTRLGDWHIASNGDQTVTIFDALVSEAKSGRRNAVIDTAIGALGTRHHEEDPIHTPRISVVAGAGLLLAHVPAMFSVIRNNPDDPENQKSSLRRFYRGTFKASDAGVGQVITTYESDGNPPQPFEGAPRPITIGRDARETVESLAYVLDENSGFLVAAAAKAVDLRTGRVEQLAIVNCYLPNIEQSAIKNYDDPSIY